MSIRVLIVDDSRFFRRRVQEILESDPQIKVIETAENGLDAVNKAQRLKPDVITMDVEMPVMDGIAATKKIMEVAPTAILMFSSLTTEGARATFAALDAGAVDFLPKRFEDISNDVEESKRVLCERVKAVGQRRLPRPASRIAPSPVTASATAAMATATVTDRAVGTPVTTPFATQGAVKKSTAGVNAAKTRLVAIGTSTGGPVALQKVLEKLPADFPYPLVLIQHMPGSFTPAFAQRLNDACAISVKEAADGDELKPGQALLAPGGKQMTVETRAGKSRVRITESTPEQNYKPSVDITFTSVARDFPGQSLAIVLTGMGADGREGARLIKQGGSPVWAQDEASCVVYGMPAAIVSAGLADHVLPLDDIGVALNTRG